MKNPVLKEIITEMCKRVGVSYDDIDFKKEGWFSEHTWSEKEQDDFMKWMSSYLLEDKKRINEISAFPGLVKRHKKELDKLINEFIMCYGWKTEYAQQSLPDDQKKKEASK